MSLTDERRREIRDAVNAQLDSRVYVPPITPTEEQWYATHYSNGFPLEGTEEFAGRVAMFRTGFTTCGICDEPTDDEDLCPLHLRVVEPYREEIVITPDPHGARQ